MVGNLTFYQPVTEEGKFTSVWAKGQKKIYFT